MDDPSVVLINSNKCGCNFGGKIVNLTTSHMQMTFHCGVPQPKVSKCCWISVKVTHRSITYLILENLYIGPNTPHIKLKNTPKVSLNGNFLEYVIITLYRYLGFCIYECNDDQDIKRQQTKFGLHLMS